MSEEWGNFPLASFEPPRKVVEGDSWPVFPPVGRNRPTEKASTQVR